MKKTLTQRVNLHERRILGLKKEIDRLRQDLDDRTRPQNRIGFEVFPEQDWDIGDKK